MINFDWRWIGAIAVIVLLTQVTRLPPVVMALILAGGGVYFLNIGWNAWRQNGGGGGGKRVTYWRGQRYEVTPSRRGPSLDWRSLGPALIFFVIGAVLVVAAASMALRSFGVYLF